MQVHDTIELGLQSKMEKQSNVEAARAEIVVELPFCAAVEIDIGLGLNEKSFVDNHVEALHGDLSRHTA
jgi:hypothetical protein